MIRIPSLRQEPSSADVTQTLAALDKCLSFIHEENDRLTSESRAGDPVVPGVLVSLDKCLSVIEDESARIKSIVEKHEFLVENQGPSNQHTAAADTLADLALETVSNHSSELVTDAVVPYNESSAKKVSFLPTAGAPAAGLAVPQAKDNPGLVQLGTLYKMRTMRSVHEKADRKTTLDPEAMKDRVRYEACNPGATFHDYYKTEGCWQAIARSKLFEIIAMIVIMTNGIWLAVEVSLNDEVFLIHADIGFQVVENVFCSLFTTEVVIRFMAFKFKRHCPKDPWFIFDSILAAIMVFETWVITLIVLHSGIEPSAGGGASSSVLRLARLVKITRVARIGRLLKIFPEINLIVKSLMATIRTVTMIMCLLLIVLYVFGIAMTQMCKGTSLEHDLFPDVITAMYSLTLGAIFPDMQELAERLGGSNPLYAFVFLLFTLISTIIIMNMLIGALVEVVGVVAAVERETIEVNNVKDQLEYVIATFGLRKDADGNIAKHMLRSVLVGQGAIRALLKAGVDPYDLPDLLDVVFKDKTKISTSEVLELLLELRANNPAKVKDLTDLRRFLQVDRKCMQADIRRIERRVIKLSGGNPQDERMTRCEDDLMLGLSSNRGTALSAISGMHSSRGTQLSANSYDPEPTLEFLPGAIHS